MSIPLSRPPIDDEIKGAILKAVDSRQYILGPECRAFEDEFAAYNGAKHAVLTSSATAALWMLVKAFGAGPGDEILVPVPHRVPHRGGHLLRRRHPGVRGRGRLLHGGRARRRRQGHPAHRRLRARASVRSSRRPARRSRPCARDAASGSSRIARRPMAPSGRAGRWAASAAPPRFPSTRPRTSP